MHSVEQVCGARVKHREEGEAAGEAEVAGLGFDDSFKPLTTKLVAQAKTGSYSSKVAVAKTRKGLFQLTINLMGKVKVCPFLSVYPPH